jgi:acyl-CoA synthetase (NDP forming)
MSEQSMNDIPSTICSINSILNARTVAVVGASSDPGKFGYMTIDSIIRGAYEGKLYAVNPKGGEILGIHVHRSLTEVPEPLDAIVVIVPAKLVPGVLREAASKGVRGAIIQSAGFREAGREDLEGEILTVSRECGIRLMGPNIQGINYLPNKLCAMFFPVIKRKGPLAIVSQSGSVTAALSEWADRDGLGISAAINLGNQTDICEADYLEFFAQDRNTHTIVMYLEGIKNGRRFLEAVKKATPRKAVVVLKAGRSETGARSAASHTGSMAGGHEVFSAACRQYGAVSVQDLVALYDSAKGLACIKQPKGMRLMIISTSGGAATLSADEAEASGLSIPSLPDELKDELKRLALSPLAHLANPLDLAGITATDFLKTARVLDHYGIADTMLINFADPVEGGIEVIKALASELRASLAVSYMGGGEHEKRGSVEIQKMRVGVFPSPERAVRGIAAAAWKAGYDRRLIQ